jgi:nitrogen fixation protein NifZ
MSYPVADPRPATIGRVVHDARRRRLARGPGTAGNREFRLGDLVRSLKQVNNDGINPRKDIGETLIQQGDAGIVRESFSFLGESYYTVEFTGRAAYVILRGREMARLAQRGVAQSLASQVKTRGVGILESAC